MSGNYTTGSGPIYYDKKYMSIQYHYGKFPPPDLQWERIIPLIGPASAAIADYGGRLSRIPNADVLLSPLTTQEAVLSSRIEGTQATMGDVLEYEANNNSDKFQGERRNDIFEILNYRAAMHEAEKLLQTLPLSQRLVRQLHGVLLSGVRGQNRSPGEFRKIPNWIGPAGCAVEEASFIPISADKLPAAMNAWENFIHVPFPDKLVQLALLHVEFDAIHPFLDGNGRIGRMFIPLFLWQNGIIGRPNFYISEFFENNQSEYYDKLRAVSQNGNWTEWCVFFMNALKEQAWANTNKANAILDLYEEMKEAIPRLVNSQYLIQALDGIFSTPIFTGSRYAKATHIPSATVRRILPLLVKNGILKIIEPAKGSRSATYAFPALLNLAEGREVF